MAIGDNVLVTTDNVTAELPYDAAIPGIIAFLTFYKSVPLRLIRAIPTAICVVSTITNFVLIASLISYKRYKSVTHVIIISLAVTDFLGCLLFPANLYLMFPHLASHNLTFLCHYLWWILSVCGTATAYHLSLFAVIRFFQLTKPIKSRAVLTPGLIVKLCLGVWFICCTTMIGLSYVHVPKQVIFEGSEITICWYPPRSAQLRDIVYGFFISIFPLAIILVFHIAKHVLVSKASILTEKQSVDSNRRTTDTKALVMVLLLFVLTFVWTAMHMIVHEVLMIPKQSYHNLLYLFEIFLRYCGAAVDPWIYAVAAKSIRQDMISFMFCRKHK